MCMSRRDPRERKTQHHLPYRFCGRYGRLGLCVQLYLHPRGVIAPARGQCRVPVGGHALGGVKGGLAAAIGSALFDLTFPAYVAEAWITFINKGAMALVAGLIVRSVPEPSRLRLILGGAAGAALYIALYLLKSYFQIRYVTPVPVETIGPLLLEKLAASSVNGIFAVIVAPLLYTVLAPGIKHLQKS